MQLFTEVKRHKPSVIYIPNVDIWWQTLSETVKSTFLGLLRSIPPTDPVLVLGVLENDKTEEDEQMIKDLFGFSKRNQFKLKKPEKVRLITSSIVLRILISDRNGEESSSSQ